MKKSIFMITMLITVWSAMIASDNYKSGDTLYVWAKNGLNLRTGPGTDYKIKSSLNFGEMIIVSMKTENSYNISGISQAEPSYYSKSVDPVIFKGNWVLVFTETGEVGYIIDQYLLKYKPVNINEPSLYGLNLSIDNIDTLFQSPIIYEGSGLNCKVEQSFDHGIIHVLREGGVWGDSHYTIPQLTIEEVMILFSASLNDFKNFTVLRNWKEEIIFTDGELCTFTVKQENGQVTLEYGCSC